MRSSLLRSRWDQLPRLPIRAKRIGSYIELPGFLVADDESSEKGGCPQKALKERVDTYFIGITKIVGLRFETRTSRSKDGWITAKTFALTKQHSEIRTIYRTSTTTTPPPRPGGVSTLPQILRSNANYAFAPVWEGLVLGRRMYIRFECVVERSVNWSWTLAKALLFTSWIFFG